MEYTIEVYETNTGKRPFNDWLIDLADSQSRYIIKSRLARVRVGNLGDCEPVGNGVYELKIDYGSGFRLYFSKTGKTIILLLCAGTKRTQEKDIKKAKEYLADYKMRGPKYAKK